MERFTPLLRQLKQLPAERGAGAEPLEPGVLMEEALAILRLHPSLRGAEPTTTGVAGLPPVRAERWRLLRLYLMLLAEAGAAGDGSLRVEGLSDERRAVVRIVAPATMAPGAHARALAHALGATLERWADGWAIELPTLAELRRRERAASGRD